MEINDNFSDRAKKDYHLVCEALDGKQSAYTAIMDRYKDNIYFLILKMVKNKDDAEDLSIEVFGKAFQRLKQYTPQYAFSTWIYKIATNHSIDFIRKKRIDTVSLDKHLQTEDGGKIELDVESESKDPEEKFIEKQKIHMMQEGVKKLSDPYKRLLELRYFEEHSYDEIAEILDIPLGTVKAQLFRARGLLFAVLEKSQHSI